jgi:hypothetical protein
MLGGAADATATATGGAAGAPAAPGQVPGIAGAANATSSALTTNGALAQRNRPPPVLAARRNRPRKPASPSW